MSIVTHPRVCFLLFLLLHFFSKQSAAVTPEKFIEGLTSVELPESNPTLNDKKKQIDDFDSVRLETRVLKKNKRTGDEVKKTKKSNVIKSSQYKNNFSVKPNSLVSQNVTSAERKIPERKAILPDLKKTISGLFRYVSVPPTQSNHILNDKINFELTVRNRELKREIARLAQDNAALRDTSDKAGQVLAARNQELTAQLEAARSEGEKAREAVPELKKEIARLAQDNAALRDTSDKAGQALAARNQELTAQLEAARSEGEKAREAVPELKKEIARLAQDNAALCDTSDKAGQALAVRNQELTAQLEAARSEGEKAREAVPELKKEIQILSSRNDDLNNQIKQSAKPAHATLKIDTPSEKYSYALGVSLFNKIKSEASQMISDKVKVKVNTKTLLMGINDASNGELKFSDKEINSIISSTNHKVSDAVSDSVSKIKTQLKGKKYYTVADGVYLYVLKSGKVKYKSNDVVNFDINERTLNGKSISNNLNNHVMLDSNLPSILRNAFEKGGRGGVVEIYGLAGYFYTPSNRPDGISPETPVKFTFNMH